MNLRDRILDEVDKESFIAFAGKGGHSRLQSTLAFISYNFAKNEFLRFNLSQ